MAQRIGIFGGTFDPPHMGHLILASEAYEQLQLTRLLWMLTPQSPHKQNQKMTKVEHRLAMVQCAIGDDKRFELSTLEFERPAPQYTVDTLLLLKEQHPSADLILLMGGDALRSLAAWHRPAALVQVCHEIGVMRRPGEPIQLNSLNAVITGLKEKVRFVDAPMLQISSSEIRYRITTNRDFRYFLPPDVYDYIQAHNLYR